MRVGILTIFDNNNIGNRLQNYALQLTLGKYACQVVTVKNKPYYSAKSRILRRLPVAESVLFNRLLGMNKRAALVRFTNQYIPSSIGSYWYDLPDEELKRSDVCNLYCAGSDQVWSPACGRTGMFNYLGFADRDRTFSYAASFGVNEIPEEHKDAVRKGLEHIKYISVREDAGKRIVEELTGRTDVQVLVDPTMLLTMEEWDKIAQKPKQKLPDRYLLTYFLGDVPPERRAAIQRQAEQMNCAVIDLMDKDGPFYVSGPGEFVYLIAHADLICTDSFHGSVFSFLYHRSLAIFDRKGEGDSMASRLETLCNKFHLHCCLVEGNELPEIPEKPDYSEGRLILEQERAKSKAFLDMVFKEAERAGLCD